MSFPFVGFIHVRIVVSAMNVLTKRKSNNFLVSCIYYVCVDLDMCVKMY